MNVVGLSLLALLLQDAAIQGIVVRASNDPLSKANVELRADGANGALLERATTDADGRFVFQNVQVGRYQVTVTRSGYVRPSLPVVVTQGQPVVNLELPMTPTAAIEGRVYDGAGDLAGNVEVQALRASYPEGRRALTRVATAWTNDLGEYRLFWLAPGRYYVMAVADSVERKLMMSGNFQMLGPFGSMFFASTATSDPAIGLPEAEPATERYVPIYFSGTTGTIDEQSASSIDLRAGSEVTGVNIVLSPVREHHVRGFVIDGLTGKPARYASVRRDDAVPPLREDPVLTVNPESGSFDIMLLPGPHTLVGSAESGTGYATIQLGDSDLENLTIVTTPAVKLRGRITVEGRTVSTGDLERLRVSLRRDPPPAKAPSTIDANYSNPLPNGTFTLQANSGIYRVNIAPVLNATPDLFLRPLPPSLQGAYLKSIRFGSADVLNGGLRLDQPQDALLDVVIGTNPGVISGSVLDDREKAVRDASVVLLPNVRQRTDLYQVVTTDLSGRFRLDLVPPGEYKIFAWASVESEAWFDPDFMSNYENRGRPLRISEGSQETVEVTVIPAP